MLAAWLRWRRSGGGNHGSGTGIVEKMEKLIFFDNQELDHFLGGSDF